jgi:DNA-binding MarR family transcriptional regulator
VYEKYSKIPLSIKNNNNLSSNAKLLYGDIQLLCYKNGYCFASNKHLGDILSVTERTITRLLSELEKNNYIKIEYSRNKRKIYLVSRVDDFDHLG